MLRECDSVGSVWSDSEDIALISRMLNGRVAGASGQCVPFVTFFLLSAGLRLRLGVSSHPTVSSIERPSS